MHLYIRALTIYPDVVIVYLALLLLDAAMPFISRLCKTMPVRFISTILPADGWRITYPFRIDRDNTHNVPRRGNCIPLVLYTLLCLFSAIEVGYVVYACWGDSFPMYMLWALLQLLLSLVTWYLELKQYMSIYKRKEHLCVIEICQCCTNAFLSVLLLEGYHGDHYTYIVPNTEHWQLGACHEAICVGAFIEKLNPDILEEHRIIWVGVGDKSTYRNWNGIVLPTFLFLIGGGLIASYVFFGYISLLVTGVLTTLLGVYYVPWPSTRNLRVVSREHTECFGDISQECYWTFVLVNNSGRPFYYQSDDGEALHISSAYTCKSVGNIVRYVEADAPKEMTAVYHPASECGELFIFYFIGIPLIITAEVLGWTLVACSVAALLTFLTVAIARYLHKGDI